MVIREYDNIRVGGLARGCQMCVRGEKLVLFVTGLCGNGCSYCPVSDHKQLKDVVYANELGVHDESDVLDEAYMMDAKGAGITGGDPLAVLHRTTKYIRLFKERYGQEFHVHLYTPLLRVNEGVLGELFNAGLDEIRFHPRLDDQVLWERMLLAKKFSWSVVIEVPVIPEFEKELESLLTYLGEVVKPDFVNLNEFEYADNLVFEGAGKRYEPKNALSYAVKGSSTLGRRLVLLGERLGLNVHFCTARSKDRVQLARRLKRRSKRAAQVFDAVDREGLLTRGAVYVRGQSCDPFSTSQVASMSVVERERIVKELVELKELMIHQWTVPEELVVLDEVRLRLLTTTSVAEHAAQVLNNPRVTVALVKEYPTADAFLVEAQVLTQHGDKD